MVRVAIVLKTLRAKSSPDPFCARWKTRQPLVLPSTPLFKDRQPFRPRVRCCSTSPTGENRRGWAGPWAVPWCQDSVRVPCVGRLCVTSSVSSCPVQGCSGGFSLPGARRGTGLLCLAFTARRAGAPRGLSLRRVQEETASPAERLPSKRFPAFSGWIPLVSVLGRQCGFIRRAGEQGCERVKGWGGHALNCDLWRGQPFCSTQTSRTGAEGHCSINRGMLPKCVITVTRYHTKDEHSGSVTLSLNGSLHFHFISPSRTHAALFPFFFFFSQPLMPESCVTFPCQV